MEVNGNTRSTEDARVVRRDFGQLSKLLRNLPWLTRYPAWRLGELVRRVTENSNEQHLILTVANHFEPAYNEEPNDAGGFGIELDLDTQLRRFDHWSIQARSIGEAVRDHDGTPFRHTNFYPAEQYHRRLLNEMAGLQADGFGEVEIHLHHGVQEPDTAENFKRVLVDFRDALAQDHKCLSRERADDIPRYAFVHGNWALANSADGRYCGVDNEMQILADTGCYGDFTLPSAPYQGQVPKINAIYQCGRALNEAVPHRGGPTLKVGDRPELPIIFSGPLVFDWANRRRGLPVPRLENGALSAASPLGIERLNIWRNAHISVGGRPEWVFIKLYCHGFFDEDQPFMIGTRMRQFLEDILELAERTRKFKLHFASAREVFNITMAAIDGKNGNPNTYRDYRLKQIMQRGQVQETSKRVNPGVEALVSESA